MSLSNRCHPSSPSPSSRIPDPIPTPKLQRQTPTHHPFPRTLSKPPGAALLRLDPLSQHLLPPLANHLQVARARTQHQLRLGDHAARVLLRELVGGRLVVFFLGLHDAAAGLLGVGLLVAAARGLFGRIGLGHFLPCALGHRVDVVVGRCGWWLWWFPGKVEKTGMGKYCFGGAADGRDCAGVDRFLGLESLGEAVNLGDCPHLSNCHSTTVP